MNNALRNLLLSPTPLRLAVAESMTCGKLQARIGSAAGASDYFLGGITAYTLAQKVKHLGVDEPTARALNCVSQDVAEQMAIGACELFDADISLATTGYAEPFPERAIKHPFAWWAVAHTLGDGRCAVTSGMIECPGADRIRAQDTVTMVALGSLERYLSLFRAGTMEEGASSEE